MFLELQFSANVFGRILRNRLRAQDLCRDQSVPNPDNFLEEMVLDQVVIGDNTTVQREHAVTYVNDQPQLVPSATQLVWFNASKGNSYSRDNMPYLQVRQEISIQLVRPHDLDANGVNASPPRTVTIYPVFNVAADFIYEGPITLTYTLAYVDFGAEHTTAVSRSLITNFLAAIPLPASTIDLGPLSELLKQPTATFNAGLACDPAGTRVALRVDFKPMDREIPATVTPDFFLDGPSDLLRGHEWAAVMDANALIAQVVPPLRDKLHDMSGVRVLADPSAAWEPAPAAMPWQDPEGPTLRVVSKIRKLAACPGFVDDIDLDVELTFRASFSLIPATHAMRIHHQLSRRFTDQSQVNGCVITGAALYPLFGAALLHQKEIGLSDYLGGLALGPILSVGQLFGVIDQQSLQEDISNDLGSQCHKINDWEYECTTPVNLRMEFVPRQSSTLVVDEIYGLPEGLVLSGSVAHFSDYVLGQINGIEYSGFGWRVDGRCNRNRDGGGSYAAINAAGLIMDVSAPPTNLLPAHICTARVINDPLHVFSILDSEPDYLNLQARSDPAYFVDPYDCVLRLVTNRGVRNINFGRAHEATDADHQELQRQESSWRRLCQAIVLTTLPFDELFKVPTRVGPPIETFGVDHWLLYRDLKISGLADDATIGLRDNDSHTELLRVRAADGVAQLRSLTALASPTAETSMYLDFGTTTELDKFTAQRQQILYAHHADIPVSSSPLDLLVQTDDTGQTLLSYSTDDTLHTWDISESVPRAVPADVRRQPARGAVSVSASQDAVLHTSDGIPEQGRKRVLRNTTRQAPSEEAFGHNSFVSFDPELQALRVYHSVKVGEPQDSRIPARAIADTVASTL